MINRKIQCRKEDWSLSILRDNFFEEDFVYSFYKDRNGEVSFTLEPFGLYGDFIRSEKLDRGHLMYLYDSQDLYKLRINPEEAPYPNETVLVWIAGEKIIHEYTEPGVYYFCFHKYGIFPEQYLIRIIH